MRYTPNRSRSAHRQTEHPPSHPKRQGYPVLRPHSDTARKIDKHSTQPGLLFSARPPNDQGGPHRAQGSTRSARTRRPRILVANVDGKEFEEAPSGALAPGDQGR